VLAVEEHLQSLEATAQETAAREAAVSHLALSLRKQRDAALRANQSMHADLIASVAESLGVTPEQAEKLLIAISHPEEVVMEYDICDLLSLAALRDTLLPLVEQLGYSANGE